MYVQTLVQSLAAGMYSTSCPPGAGVGRVWPGAGSTPRFGTHAQNSLPFRRGGGSGGRARGEGAAEEEVRVAGTRTRPRGSPGQHASLWASKRLLLQPPSCTASGGPDFRVFTTQRHSSMDADKGRPDTSSAPGHLTQASDQPGAYRPGSELKTPSPASRGVAGVEVGSALAFKALPMTSLMARGAGAVEGGAL